MLSVEVLGPNLFVVPREGAPELLRSQEAEGGRVELVETDPVTGERTWEIRFPERATIRITERGIDYLHIEGLTIAQRIARLRGYSRLEGAVERLDKVRSDAEDGDPGALGELRALERWASEGRRIEVLEEVQNAGRKNPDYRVEGQITEVKTRNEPLNDRYIKDQITAANKQVSRSGLEGSDAGAVEIQLDGAAAETPFAIIERQVLGNFNAGRGRSLTRVSVFRNGELAGEWARAEDGSVSRRFPAP